MSTITSPSPKGIPNRRLLLTGLMIVLGIAVLAGFVWMRTDQVIALPDLRLVPDTGPAMVPLATVDAFHHAVNHDDIESLRVLFAEDAIVIDNGTVFEAWNRSGVGLNIFTCQPIKFEMIDIQVDGEKVVWYDLIHNDPGSEYSPRVLRWNAVIQDGKIQSLTVRPLPMPDKK